MTNTTHLQLPLLAAAQAQKHVTHNEAIHRLDAIVQISVIDRDLTAPPAEPSEGDRYIVADSGTGAWTGWDDTIAWFVDGAWSQIVPNEGWLVWIEDENAIQAWDGSAWIGLSTAISTWQIHAASAVAASHTGNTNETALATITIPGGAMGANGVLRITTAWAQTDSGNDKTARIRFGGPAGTAYLERTDSGAVVVSTFQRYIANRNAENQQTGFFSATSAHSYQAVGGAHVTSSENTSSDVDLVISGQLADAGDTITLEGYLIELFHQA